MCFLGNWYNLHSEAFFERYNWRYYYIPASTPCNFVDGIDSGICPNPLPLDILTTTDTHRSWATEFPELSQHINVFTEATEFSEPAHSQTHSHQPTPKVMTAREQMEDVPKRFKTPILNMLHEDKGGLRVRCSMSSPLRARYYLSLDSRSNCIIDIPIHGHDFHEGSDLMPTCYWNVIEPPLHEHDPDKEDDSLPTWYSHAVDSPLLQNDSHEEDDSLPSWYSPNKSAIDSPLLEPHSDQAVESLPSWSEEQKKAIQLIFSDKTIYNRVHAHPARKYGSRRQPRVPKSCSTAAPSVFCTEGGTTTTVKNIQESETAKKLIMTPIPFYKLDTTTWGVEI